MARAERRLPSLAWLALGLALALPLATVSWLPALHLVGASERRAGLSFDDATVWSLHPLRLGELVWPRLFGGAPPDESFGHHVAPTWAFSVYLGAPVVVLAAVAVARERGARAIAAIAGVMLVIALGRYTPLYGWYRAIVVPERFVRYPEKHVGAVVVLVAALAGVGWSHAFAAARARRLATSVGAILATLAVGFAVGRAFGAALACALVAAAVVARRPSLALAALAAHLALEGWAVQPLVPRAALTRVPPLLAAALPSGPPRPRLYRPAGLEPRSQARSPAEASVAERDTGVENAGAPFGFAHVPGFDAALNPRWHEVWDAGVATGARLLDRFDVKWVVLPEAAIARTPFVPRAGLGGLVLAENRQRRPRAFVSTRWRFAADDDARSALFDPAHAGETQLAGAGAPPAAAPSPSPDGAARPGGDDVPCAIATTRPESIELRCDAPADGYAVLLDAFADGWRASVDGAPAPIVRADVVARAVAIAKGRHTIAMSYRTPGLRAGALVSLLAWLVWLGAALKLRSA